MGFYSTFSLSDTPVIVSGHDALVLNWSRAGGKRLETFRKSAPMPVQVCV